MSITDRTDDRNPPPSRGVRLDELFATRPPVDLRPSVRMLTRHVLTTRRLREIDFPARETALVRNSGGLDAVRAEIIVRELTGEGVGR